MVVQNNFLFTTGPAVLPDVGVVKYSGCSFSPLFTTSVKGVMAKDNSGRTTKYMKYTIAVDGYVTLVNQLTDISSTMKILELNLSQQGGDLTYTGRGLDIVTSPQTGVGLTGVAAAGASQDVAWGPIPRILDFQPLGGGLSARVKWEVEVALPKISQSAAAGAAPKDNSFGAVLSSRPLPHLLQFNYDSSVTYGEDGYSTVTCTGILEVPLTRRPTQDTRTLSYTADDYRTVVEGRLLSSVDLSRFIVTKRVFKTSQDKRTLEWTFELEEKRYMDLPPYCTVARGTFSVRQARQGMGNVQWLCSLRATYTLRKDAPRRMAWVAFLMLLRLRMSCSVLGHLPPQTPAKQQNPDDHNLINFDIGNRRFHAIPTDPAGWMGNAGENLKALFNLSTGNEKANAGDFRAGGAGFGGGAGGAAGAAAGGGLDASNCRIMDFNFDEGLYKDSGNVTFSCTWRVITTQSHILLASGLWTKVPETDAQGGNLWASSMKDVMGSSSWLKDRLDPKLDLIVDFGGP